MGEIQRSVSQEQDHSLTCICIIVCTREIGKKLRKQINRYFLLPRLQYYLYLRNTGYRLAHSYFPSKECPYGILFYLSHFIDRKEKFQMFVRNCAFDIFFSFSLFQCGGCIEGENSLIHIF